MKRKCAVIILCCLALMLTGSFLDWTISCSLYNPQSVYGNFFDKLAEFPLDLFCIIAGFIFINAALLQKGLIKIAEVLLGGVVCLVGITSLLLVSMRYFDIGGLTISVIMVCLLGVMVRYYSRESNGTVLIVGALLILVTCMFEERTISIIKEIWGRTRMRLIVADERAYFRSWWLIGNPIKSAMIESGVNPDDFRSFPSGHTSSMALFMLLPCFSLVFSKLKYKELPLMLTGAFLSLMMALSRIIMGAHFLTDTVVGFFVSFTLSMCCYGILYSLTNNMKSVE